MKKGDLAYIPSEATLYQYDRQQQCVANYTVVKKPSSAVVVEHQYDTYTVFYEGQTWFVRDRDVYPFDNKEERIEWQQ